MLSPSTYWHTLRHLKPVQVYGRIWFQVARPGVDLRPAPRLRPLKNDNWVSPARRTISLLESTRFCFSHEVHDLREVGWDNPSIERLWRYHLHYFDDLNAHDASSRREQQCSLLSRWVLDNPAGQGTGWEPYPTSLRIVNWIKWALAGNSLPSECMQSLAVQARWLSRRLEIHLLGNHLFSNAKALVFAGCFFDGPEADGWLKKGLTILDCELREQILADGAHFERSPMYHSIALEDLLDLMNLSAMACHHISTQFGRFASSLPEIVSRMRRWLAAMCHPDGEISFFNDAAIGMAPSPTELDAYARRLHLSFIDSPRDGITHLSDSGYIRVQQGDMVALLDVAPVGPDYLPGHAHADTLSFELSLFERRIAVNSGTGCYGDGWQRRHNRSTAAHNTVEVNGRNSSEVWGGFRVGRRARPIGLHIDAHNGCIAIGCGHDGYRHLKGSPIHRREWRFTRRSLTITDHIDGSYQEAVSRIYFSPELQLFPFLPDGTGQTVIPGCHPLQLLVRGAKPEVVPATYYPEFGLAEPNQCLTMPWTESVCLTGFSWD